MSFSLIIILNEQEKTKNKHKDIINIAATKTKEYFPITAAIENNSDIINEKRNIILKEGYIVLLCMPFNIPRFIYDFIEE